MRAAAGSRGGFAEQALVAAARAGDEEAFRNLTEPYARELHVHCYRMLGSVYDAEDAPRRRFSAHGAISGASRPEALSEPGCTASRRTSA